LTTKEELTYRERCSFFLQTVCKKIEKGVETNFSFYIEYMVKTTISLQERQNNIHEAITDISRCDSLNNLNGVLAGALFSWKQKMNNKYMHSYPYMSDVYTVLLYTNHLTPGKIEAIRDNFGSKIHTTLHAIDTDLLKKEYANDLLDTFLWL